MRRSSRVVRPLARRAVVPPAGGQPSFVKALDRFAVGLKRDVQPCRGRPVGAYVDDALLVGVDLRRGGALHGLLGPVTAPYRGPPEGSAGRWSRMGEASAIEHARCY